MATDLNEMQFELLPSETAAAGALFGLGLPISVDEEGFIPGSTEWADEDQDNAGRGGTTFGRDRLMGPDWAWEAFVNEKDVISAKRTLAAFRTAWHALHIRETPGLVIPLRYRFGDEVRRIYGRPRGFDAPPNNRILSGFVPISCDFKAVNGFIYDDAEQVVTLGAQAASQGGFVFPVVFPVNTLPVGIDQVSALVGGDAPTHPVVTFFGPVTNPELITAKWTLKVNIALAEGERVEVDTRPWRLTAIKNGSTSVAGLLGKRTRLADIKFAPGQHALSYRGANLGGSSTCRVRWAAAHNSI